jgi:hypothetical protein
MSPHHVDLLVQFLLLLLGAINFFLQSVGTFLELAKFLLQVADFLLQLVTVALYLEPGEHHAGHGTSAGDRGTGRNGKSGMGLDELKEFVHGQAVLVGAMG